MPKEIKVFSIEQLLKTLDRYYSQFSMNPHVDALVFRGNSTADWKLLPKVYRVHNSPKYSSFSKQTYLPEGEDIYRSSENSILSHFKHEAYSYLPNIPITDDRTWIQYAQHYWVPTRLLDFTGNPLVALFFCCYDETPVDGALWLISTSHYSNWMRDDPFCAALKRFSRNDLITNIIGQIKKGTDSSENSEIPDMSKPVFLFPEYIDHRMSSQVSRFLLWGTNQSALEDMIDEENWMTLSDENTAEGDFNDKRFLAKLIIPASAKHRIMNQLSTLGITEKSIYPGVEGIGRFIDRIHRADPDDTPFFN